MKQKQEVQINTMEDIFEKNINKKPKMNKFFSFIASLLSKFYDSQTGPMIKFTYEEDKIIVKEEVKPLTDLQIKADQFIAIEEYGILKTMVQNGYELLPSQNNAIENYIGTLLMEYGSVDSKHREIESWLELGLNLNKEYVSRYLERLIGHLNKPEHNERYSAHVYEFHNSYPVSFFYNDKGNMKNTLNDGTEVEYPLLTKKIRDITNENKIFKQKFTLLIDFSSINNHYARKGATKNILTLTEMLRDERKSFLAKELSFDEFLQLVIEFNKSDVARHSNIGVIELKKELQKFLNENYGDNLKEIINNVKEEYSDKYIEKIIINNIQEETKHITMDSLPVAAKDILSDIRSLYTKIQKSDIKPTETEIFTINNLFNKTVPEILRKYLTIDEQYQTILTNAAGKNPQILMIDSLKNIHSNFEEVWENINNQAVSSLSATNKYTKNFKR